MSFDGLPQLSQGTTLRIRVFRHPRSSAAPSVNAHARILQAFRPFTMSPVLRVSLSSQSSPFFLPSDAVLKLYDRRCLTNLRGEKDTGGPWNPHKERAYRRLLAAVSSGSVVLPDFDDPQTLERGFSEGELEAFFQREADQMFHNECRAYEILQSLQGKEIPMFYGTFEWEIDIPTAGGYTVTEVVRGVLLEYIPGPSLRRFVETWATRQPALPVDVLTHVCDRALAVVNHTSDFDVLDEDVRMDNFIVREPLFHTPSTSEPQSHQSRIRNTVDHPVVLIDLAQSRTRPSYLTDEEWRMHKWIEDEEGAVGCNLMTLLRKFVSEGIWKYTPSYRYYPEDPEFDITQLRF